MIDRTVAPSIVVPNNIDVLKAEKNTINGYDIYTINCSDIDVVKICFVFNAGVKFQNISFLASSTLNLISEGTSKYSAKQIAEILDFYGIYFDANIDRDNTIVTFCCLRRFLDQTIDLACQILSCPLFDKDELSIHTAKRKQSIRIEREKSDYLARELFAEALYGKNHPYGKIADEKDYDILTPDMLRQFFDIHYTAQNSFVVMSGKLFDTDIEKVMGIVEKMRQGTCTTSDIYKVESTKDIFLERPNARQSSIRIGKVLFNKQHPDYVGMQVVSTILGGYFSSRIVSNIREDKGYTYGAFAGMITMQDSGFFAVSSEVAVLHTDDAVREILKEIEILQTEFIEEDELNMVRSVMIGDIMRVLDGPFGIADVTIDNILLKYDNSYIENMIEQINSITPEKIRELTVKYLSVDTLTTVIVGVKQ